MPIPSPLSRRTLPQRARLALSRRARHTARLSRHSFRFAVFLGGAAAVALFSLAFAWLSERMLDWNQRLTQSHAWIALPLMPIAFAALRWLTIRVAPQARGSGIPQVIAAMSMPAGGAQTLLVSLPQSLWKIVLTAGGLLAGASIGREGPSVQVGAAAMLAWGRWWQGRGRFAVGFRPEALIAAGAAGGLAAAFNTPLAGVVFAIEELGRGSAVRWDRLVLSGVLAAGFLSLAMLGDHTYFPIADAIRALGASWSVVALCALVNGTLGGLFAKTLLGGPLRWLPTRWRAQVARRPIAVAAGCGLLVALIGIALGGATYGTGYGQVAALLNGQSGPGWGFGIGKFAATVLSYFAGTPGGIFTPSLAIGAGLGDTLAHLLPGATDARLAVLLSMAAFLAGATQAPITASVIVMEMTRTHDLTLLLLAATLGASVVSRQFCPRPFYHTASRHFRREALAASEAPARHARDAASGDASGDAKIDAKN
ncbi:MAG: chloride channel protein [Burkholderiaceae bacterium]